MASQHKKAGVNRRAVRYPVQPERIGTINPLDGLVVSEDVGRARPPGEPSEPNEQRGAPSRRALPVQPIYRDDAHGIWLYQGNCLAILDAIPGLRLPVRH